jgi:hypothetical protein
MAVLAVSPTWLFVADGIYYVYITNLGFVADEISYMSAFGMLYAFISSVWFLQVPLNIAVLVEGYTALMVRMVKEATIGEASWDTIEDRMLGIPTSFRV